MIGSTDFPIKKYLKYKSKVFNPLIAEKQIEVTTITLLFHFKFIPVLGLIYFSAQVHYHIIITARANSTLVLLTLPLNFLFPLHTVIIPLFAYYLALQIGLDILSQLFIFLHEFFSLIHLFPFHNNF